MRAAVRLLLMCGLLVGVLGLGVHYYAAGPSFPYPGPEEIATDPDDYVGGEVVLFATVEAIDREQRSAQARIGLPDEDLMLAVSGFDSTNVRPGGTVQIYGTLQSADHVQATNIVVVTPTATTNRTKYLLSGVGALLVLVVFFRHWTVDIGDLGFVCK